MCCHCAAHKLNGNSCCYQQPPSQAPPLIAYGIAIATVAVVASSCPSGLLVVCRWFDCRADKQTLWCSVAWHALCGIASGALLLAVVYLLRRAFERR